MHFIQLTNRYGAQFLEIDNAYGDSGTWRQIKPIASRSAQTLNGAHGKWQWEEVVSSTVSGRTRITARAWEFKLTDFNGKDVSLGLQKDKSLPAANYRPGYITDLNGRHLRANGQVMLPSPDIAWRYVKKVNFASAWAGPFVKIGGHMAAVGTETAIGVVFNINTGQACRVMMETGRFGPGLGGAGGMAIGILTGFANSAAMRNHRESGWDFSVALSSNWDAYVKSAGAMKPLAKLMSSSSRITSLAKAGRDVSKGLATAWESAGTAGDIAKVCMTSAGNFADDNPTVSMLDLPGAGGGIELSVFKSWTEVTEASLL